MSEPESEQPEQLKVLIVCLGNICRSPMGEAVLADIARKRGLDIIVDSAGTSSYHVGEKPDERTIVTCLKHQIPVDRIARQVEASDFTEFTHILASDENNFRDLDRIKPPEATAEVRLWGSYIDGKPIPDPYYEGMGGFEKIFQQITELSNAFLNAVLGEVDSKIESRPIAFGSYK